MNKIKLGICDDHPLVAEGIKSYFNINKKIDFVLKANDKTMLLKLLSKTNIDVLLLDVNLKDDFGPDICKEIMALYPKIKIIGLSTFDDSTTILKMISSGALGYLIKSSSLKEIEKAVEIVHAGEVYYCNEAQLALLNFSKNQTDKPIITTREKDVLRLLANGLSSTEIATELFISAQTVDSHRKNLLSKFKVNKTVNLITKAKEFGVI